MQTSDKELFTLFFNTYTELNSLLENQLDSILQNKILYRALERLLGILAITTKRIHKAHPQWDIPHLKSMIRLKNQVIWDFQPLKLPYLQHIIQTVLPAIHTFLLEKNNNPHTNES